MEIVAISYNMSVFSAMGYYGNKRKLSFTKGHVENTDDSKGIFPSEARFLQRATTEKAFFNESVGHLVKTVRSTGASLIGIQEFYIATLDDILNPLKAINKKFGYSVFNKKITNDARVLTIWDETIFGKMKTEYHEDIGSTVGFEKRDLGRPISIITTTNDYIFINFHGINRPRLDFQPVDAAPLLQTAVEFHAEKAGILGMDLNKLIIMCDSNDRGHLINKQKGIILNGINFHDGHEPENGAKSCCYNYDSCGLDFPDDEGPIPKSMGEKASESNYTYTGDYVLGANVLEPVVAIKSPQDSDGASIASDHMLVYAKVSVPAKAGNRKKTKRLTRKRLTRKRSVKY